MTQTDNATALTSPADALAERHRIEESLLSVMTDAVTDFLSRVESMAVEAMSSATLVAAVRDPFAFTNVKAAWYSTVRSLAEQRDDLVTEEIEDLLLNSSLPGEAFADTVAVLRNSRNEEWTTYKTKRELSRLLIPKNRDKGGTPERARYRNYVVRLARTAATANAARRQLVGLREEGITRKMWVTRHDERVRIEHRMAHGDTTDLASPFTVGGYPMQFPGDPSAPTALTMNCRCVLVGVRTERDGTEQPQLPVVAAAAAAAADTDSRTRTGDTTMTTVTTTYLDHRLDEMDDGADCGCDGTPDEFAVSIDGIDGIDGATAADIGTDSHVNIDDESKEDSDRTTWRGIIGVEGEMTGDGRIIEADSLAWETPILLRHVDADMGAHDGARVVGRVTHIERLGDGSLWAEGSFDEGSEAGREAARQVGEGLTTGVSMDLDDVTFEVRVAAEMADIDSSGEDGTVELTSEDVDDDGKVTVHRAAPDDEIRVTTSGRVRAVTLVAIPAFSRAHIGLTETMTAGGSITEDTFNWVDDVGGLPSYIDRIRKHLQKKGMSEGHAIATAVNVVKKACSSGDLNWPGKQKVNADSRAQACKAVAEWEAKKARANADSATTETMSEAIDQYRDFTEKERKRMADEGTAMKDGSFPIATKEDLKNAVQAIGRAKDYDKAKAHIVKRAKALDATDLLPEEWDESTAGDDDSDNDDKNHSDSHSNSAESITAAASSMDAHRAPREWFRDPGLTGPSGVMVDEDGRVYGHVATWDTCHISHTAPGKCVRPPRSQHGYAYFNTGAYRTSEGEVVAIGRITMNTGHAPEKAGPTETMAHYENTGTIAAYAAAGEDEFGIWIAGTLAPGMTEADVQAFMSAPLSGDWRGIGGNLELVAALSVNTGGFPVPRPAGMVASGEQVSLVAAGMLPPEDPDEDGSEQPRLPGLSSEDVTYLRALADRERRREVNARAGESLASRVRVSNMAARLKGLGIERTISTSTSTSTAKGD